MKLLTSTGLALAIVGIGFIVAQGIRAEDRSPSGLSPSKIVMGEVAQVQGEFHMAKGPEGDVTLDIVDKSYVITSQTGKEVRLELDDHTKIQNRVNPGDKVEAKISSRGHTLSVTRLDR
ncbi:MAG TPA: hypothetical protein VLL06_02910 [Nitrospiraceae bacterium]|nr:hypothetical protein [Nitrospiraceae bacterium]